MSERRFKIQGRVKHCVIENLPVIAEDGRPPECYVGGDAEFILKAMNSYPALYEAAKNTRQRHDERAKQANFSRCGCDDCRELDGAIALAQGKETE